MEKKKRKRIKSFNKWWTKEDTLVFLRKVLENKNTFEKPSAQIFYKKIIVEEDSLAEYSWREMRDRMRNLKKKYKDALTWKVNTRVLHLDYKSETAVVNYMLRLCPFFKEIDEICRGNANVPSPLVSDSTNSVSVLEGGGNFKGVVITESEEEYPLNQPSWVATTATPLQPEDQLETPSLHGRISYKEIVSGNPGMESVKVPPNYLTQVFHSENSKQQSEIEVECLSSSNHSERIQPATLQIASKIDTSGKTNRKLSQPLPSSSKNKKTPFDHEVRANDELEEMPKRSTLVTVNKVDNFDHFGKYVSSILRNLRKQSALRLQKNISNMITKTICRPADFSKNNNADGDIEDDEDHCYVGHITTINTSTMIGENGPPKKRSRKLDDFDKLISLAHKHLEEPQTEFDKIASIWAIELQKMKPQQQLFAKKAVNDVLFEGQLGTLQKGSLQINSARYTPAAYSRVQQSPIHCRTQQEQSVLNALTEPVIGLSSNAP